MTSSLSLRIIIPLGYLLLIFTGLRPVPPAGAGNGGPTAGADSGTTRGETYLWPTDASNRITSTFAEYRTTHFHGGFDISTNGVKGYNVFAVRDGYVCEVRITPNGYGKMLFIKQDDGYISTFAHLDGFNEAITRVVRAEQYRRGTYAVDLTIPPNTLRVKRGDVVARTGDTGFGPPHLHFELRDSSMNPVNPYDIAQYSIPDHLPPVIKRILITPLTPSSTIDNGDRPKILSRFPRKHDGLLIPQTFILHGKIGFGVEAIDRSDGTWSKSGIYALQFAIDDSVIYSMKLDRVPADETKQIDLHYDLHTILQGWGKFQKLYIDTGNSLPFYDNKPEGTGIISTEHLTQGTHSYLIACRDFSGNETRLRGKFIVNHSPVLASVSKSGDTTIVIHGSHILLAKSIDLAGMNFSSHAWKEYPSGKMSYVVNDSTIRIPADMVKNDLLRVTALTPWGSRTPPLYYFSRKPSESLRPVYCKSEVFDNYVRVTVTSTGMFTAPPVVAVQEGPNQQRLVLEATDLYKYSGSFVPSAEFAGKRDITVRAEINGKPAFASDEVEMYSVPTSHAGSFTIPPWNLKVSYDSGAVFHPLHMQISEDEFKRSSVFIFEPQDQLLNTGIRIGVPYDRERAGRHAGLFFRANGGWLFQTFVVDSVTHCFTTTLTRTLGELAVLEDDQPPAIGRLRVTSKNKIPVISFRYVDNLSGVDTDEIKVYIDDTLVIPEIDGEHRTVFYTGDGPLSPGKHIVRITAKDRMKNESTVSRMLSIR
jgi:hypothetical protein